MASPNSPAEIPSPFKDQSSNAGFPLPDLIHNWYTGIFENGVLANVLRDVEAVEQFSGILVALKMEFDDSVGGSGEDVKPLKDDLSKALQTVYYRYSTYLYAFGHEEYYLRKKVETELGTKRIHLKM